MKKTFTRKTFLFIYALIILTALIYILFIAPESSFYNKETKEFIKNYEKAQEDLNKELTLNDMFKHLENNDYKYTYSLLDSVNNETIIYKCSGTVNKEEDNGSCTEPKDIVYNKDNKKNKLQGLNFNLLDISYIKKLTEENEDKVTEYETSKIHKFSTQIDSLKTEINIVTSSKDIAQIEISNGYETYVIKFSDINY